MSIVISVRRTKSNEIRVYGLSLQIIPYSLEVAGHQEDDSVHDRSFQLSLIMEINKHFLRKERVDSLQGNLSD